MGKLTDRTVKSAAQGRHGDGDGLHLIVSPSGRRSWVLRYQKLGVRRDMGLGSYPEVGLAEARNAAIDARRSLAAGIDPIEARQSAKKAERAVPTFEDIATIVVAEAQKNSSNDKVKYQWEQHLGPTYCGPLLRRPVNLITTSEVAAILKTVWHSKPALARKLLPAIRRVFDHARVILRDRHDIELIRNPAEWSDLKALGFEPPKKLSRGSHPALGYVEMPQFMAALKEADTIGSRALEILILTNVRTDAVLKAQWKDIDLETAIWTVPLENLKDRKHRTEGFRVPLSKKAVELLKLLKDGQTSTFVFPGNNDKKPISNMAMLMTVRRMNNPDAPKWIDQKSKKPITPHGFRATFRTWSEECVSFPHATIEQAMGHIVGDEVERVYRRTDLLDQRRQLMEAWASFIYGKENVVQLKRRA
jgi:integrase